MSAPNDVVAVVTTFHPTSAILPNLERIAAQIGRIIVVDDSGATHSHSDIHLAAIDKITLIRNEANIGIAASLNRGLAHAARLGCQWVLTLDDDTLISNSYVSDVLAFAESGRAPALGLVACSRGENGLETRHNGTGFQLKRTLITSGCLFDIQLFQDLGGFDERLFIDLVDFDFCTRLRKAGRQLVLLDKIGMQHKVGHSKSIRILGRTTVIYNHAPFRLYYQIRNTLFFAKKHFAFDPVLCGYLLLDIVRLPIKALFFEQQKASRLRYLAQGLFDGLRGKGGRITEDTRQRSQ